MRAARTADGRQLALAHIRSVWPLLAGTVKEARKGDHAYWLPRCPPEGALGVVVFVLMLMGCRKSASASQTARPRASGAWLGTWLAASVCGRTRRAAYIQGVVIPIPYTHARPSGRFPPAGCMLNTLLSASSATPSLPPPCSVVDDARSLLAVRDGCDGRRKGEDGRSGSGREALGVGLPPGFQSLSGAAGEALFTVDAARYTRPSRAGGVQVLCKSSVQGSGDPNKRRRRCRKQ